MFVNNEMESGGVLGPKFCIHFGDKPLRCLFTDYRILSLQEWPKQSAQHHWGRAVRHYGEAKVKIWYRHIVYLGLGFPFYCTGVWSLSQWLVSFSILTNEKTTVRRESILQSMFLSALLDWATFRVSQELRFPWFLLSFLGPITLLPVLGHLLFPSLCLLCSTSWPPSSSWRQAPLLIFLYHRTSLFLLGIYEETSLYFSNMLMSVLSWSQTSCLFGSLL